MMAIISIGIDSLDLGAIMLQSQLNDSDANRILAAYTNLLGPSVSEETVDGVTVQVQRPLTPREVATAIRDATIAGLLDNTYRWEVEQAVKAATAGVLPIVATNIVPE